MPAIVTRLNPDQYQLKDQVVSINRVTKVVKGGKNLSFAALVVVGDPAAGVIAGKAVRAVMESAGISNVLTKSIGTTNPHNVIKATFAALTQLRDKHNVAALRGKTPEEI